MRISLFAVLSVVLGLAVGYARAEKADTGAMPQIVDPAADDSGPQMVPTLSDAAAQQGAAPAVPAKPQQPGEAAAPSLPPAPAAPAPPDPPKPWTLPELGCLQQMGIKQYGWLEQGMIFNSLSPNNRWNGPVYTDDRSNDYEMNQLWLGWERPVDTHGCGWDVGGRVDIMYGSDWRYGESYGLENNIDAQHNLYGFIIPQCYMEVGYDNLTVKLGHYAPCIGYEVVAAPGNFFYSHSYALGYSEPVLVTGAQADYKLNDAWNLIAGFHDGFNHFEDQNGKFHFLGGAKWHNDEHKVSLSLMVDAGDDVGPQDPLGTNQQYLYSMVFKKQFNEKLLYAFEQVLGGTCNGDPRTGGYAKWYGLDQYLIYTINPRWSAGARVEWFDDENGSRVAGGGSVGYMAWPAAPGFAGTFTEVTLGLNWHPHPNFVVRPELRWDDYSGSTNLQNQLPFGDGAHSSQFLFATDLIFSF